MEAEQKETSLEDAVDELRAAARAATVVPPVARLRARRLQIFFAMSLKWIVGRPRPIPSLVHILIQEKTFSFPSGHVMHYVAFYGFLFFLAYALLKRSFLRLLLLVVWGGLVLLVGLSRIYLGAHWP